MIFVRGPIDLLAREIRKRFRNQLASQVVLRVLEHKRDVRSVCSTGDGANDAPPAIEDLCAIQPCFAIPARLTIALSISDGQGGPSTRVKRPLTWSPGGHYGVFSIAMRRLSRARVGQTCQPPRRTLIGNHTLVNVRHALPGQYPLRPPQ